MVDNVSCWMIHIGLDAKESFLVSRGTEEGMEHFNHLGLSDGSIRSIKIIRNEAEVVIERWNAKGIKLIFENCWRLKDRQSTDQTIGDIKLLKESHLMNELIADILDGGGMKDEVEGAVPIVFCEPFDNRIILEIIASSVRVEEVELPFGE